MKGNEIEFADKKIAFTEQYYCGYHGISHDKNAGYFASLTHEGEKIAIKCVSMHNYITCIQRQRVTTKQLLKCI
jgi:hypothetical protein